MCHVPPKRLGTLEATWDIPWANIEKQAKGDRKVEVDAQNVCSECSAEAHCGFKINKALDEGAAWGHWWLTQSHIQQPV